MSSQFTGSTTMKKMAKVTVGKSTRGTQATNAGLLTPRNVVAPTCRERGARAGSRQAIR